MVHGNDENISIWGVYGSLLHPSFKRMSWVQQHATIYLLTVTAQVVTDFALPIADSETLGWVIGTSCDEDLSWLDNAAYTVLFQKVNQIDTKANLILLIPDVSPPVWNGRIIIVDDKLSLL